MSYARLMDVWPEWQYNDKFQRYANTLPKNIVNNLIDSSDNRGGNKYTKKRVSKPAEPVMYEKSRNYPLDEKKDKVPVEKFSNVMYGKYYSECSTILKHLAVCDKCRQFIQKKFVPPPKEVEEEEEENDEYLDLAIYIITGVFVLFLLDMLMKFGKNRR